MTLLNSPDVGTPTKQSDAALALRRALTGQTPADRPSPVPSGTKVYLDVLDGNYAPAEDGTVVLVADDGGPALLLEQFAQPTLRVTVYGPGRETVRSLAADIAGWLKASRIAGIARISNVSTLLTGRDTDTGARFASFTAPSLTRPV